MRYIFSHLLLKLHTTILKFNFDITALRNLYFLPANTLKYHKNFCLYHKNHKTQTHKRLYRHNKIQDWWDLSVLQNLQLEKWVSSFKLLKH